MIDGKELKFCIITNNASRGRPIHQKDLAGFYQWAKAFNGDVIYIDGPFSCDKNIIGAYDIILIRLSEENYSLIEAVSEMKKEKTKLVLCCDIPVVFWGRYYKDLSGLEKAALKGDMVFTTEYSISERLQKLTGRRIYEIPHPADIEKISRYKNMEKENTMVILYNNGNKKHKIFLMFCRIFTGLKPFFADNMGSSGNEKEFSALIAKSKLVISLPGFSNYGKLIVYAAVLGAFVIGTGQMDSQRRCYPHTCIRSVNFLIFFIIYIWHYKDAKLRKFVLESAFSSSMYYNRDNTRNRLLEILYTETTENKFNPVNIEQWNSSLPVNYYRDIRLVYGPADPEFKDFAVISLVKNGSPFIETFIKHYRELGAGHFFIIDNGSEDNTVKLLKNFENVTIYSTKLPHKLLQCEIRRSVIERHCRNKWCLYADIDELFDFPYSEKIGMKGLIGYLTENKYTALAAYTLEMFSDNDIINSDKNRIGNNIENTYNYYDISMVGKMNYFRSRHWCRYNILGDEKIRSYDGGIRRKYFKTGYKTYMLIKHPFLYIDNFIEVLTNPHYCDKAKIADITGILKHYKFVDFKSRVSYNLAHDSDYTIFAKRQNYAYKRAMKSKKMLNLFSGSARKFTGVNQLLDEGYIRASKKYDEYAGLNKELIDR
jgi:hypothetical protein